MEKHMQSLFEQIEKDPQLSQALFDPVMFSVVLLDTTPRWYQAKLLRDPHKLKVARMGRRTGKTFTMILHMIFMHLLTLTANNW